MQVCLQKPLAGLQDSHEDSLEQALLCLCFCTCSVAPYLRPGGGGVTCSGGEPLLQPQFTAAVFREAHALGLTTCLDTTGQGTKRQHWDHVLPHTDMVLFCIKHLHPEKYAGLTGLRQIGALRFATELQEQNIPFWLRYVLIPGHTDDADGIKRLAEFAHQHEPAMQVGGRV